MRTGPAELGIGVLRYPECPIRDTRDLIRLAFGSFSSVRAVETPGDLLFLTCGLLCKHSCHSTVQGLSPPVPSYFVLVLVHQRIPPASEAADISLSTKESAPLDCTSSMRTSRPRNRPLVRELEYNNRYCPSLPICSQESVTKTRLQLLQQRTARSRDLTSHAALRSQPS